MGKGLEGDGRQTPSKPCSCYEWQCQVVLLDRQFSPGRLRHCSSHQSSCYEGGIYWSLTLPNKLIWHPQRIITFASDSYSSHQTGQPPPSIGLGIGLSFVLFILLLISSWCTHHHNYWGMGSGILLCRGLIMVIYSCALRLTPRSRVVISSSRLINHISTDVSHINYCMGYFHIAWTSIIQLTICLTLLLINLGPSVLAGFTLLVIITPINTFTAKCLFVFRLKSMKWTDSCSRSLQEIISGINIIKFFSWEMPFLKRITKFRQLELGCVYLGTCRPDIHKSF